MISARELTTVAVGRELAVITGPDAALASCASDPARLGAVPGSVRGWCALGESNPSCRNENPES